MDKNTSKQLLNIINGKLDSLIKELMEFYNITEWYILYFKWLDMKEKVYNHYVPQFLMRNFSDNEIA